MGRRARHCFGTRACYRELSFSSFENSVKLTGRTGSKESPAAANQRYLVAAGKYSPQQVMDYIWKAYPARAAERGISKGSSGKLWPEGGVFTVDMEKSTKDLGIKYRPLEETLKDTFTRLEKLEAQT